MWVHTIARALPVAKVHTFFVDNSSKHQVVRNQIDGWNEGEKDIPSPRHDGGAEKTQLAVLAEISGRKSEARFDDSKTTQTKAAAEVAM